MASWREIILNGIRVLNLLLEKEVTWPAGKKYKLVYKKSIIELIRC
jgi:hypothetical protein